jgi:hypothetical protein
MTWYLEIYDQDGILLSSENGATYEAVVDAVMACHSGHFGQVRFRGPDDASLDQLQLLERLKAKPAV